MFHQNQWHREWTLLDEPLRVVAGRTVTDSFTVPANTTYEMNIYVQEKVPYADCLLGQGGYLEDRCARYGRVIDVAWALHGKDGSILRQGVSGGTCCSYTTDEHNNRVVYTKLDAFKLPSETAAHLELRYKRNLAQVTSLDPRIVVERTSEASESEAVAEAIAYMGITLLAGIGVVLLVIVALRRCVLMLKAKSVSPS